ncbi:tetratricopeptide repeat protein, partial [Nostoc sp.]|uniref:tetratricopeptide repeat protein n=1 Tax=Nostoc sp. TaxID=1180 RepID=UPI002FFC203A
MDTGTGKNNLYWLNPDVLIEFIDELREVGYKIGISQYIAAQDLIVMLIAQGETLDSPEYLRNLLGPIFCSSPIEQEEFQQHFNRWVELFSQTNLPTEEVNVEAQVLSKELKKIQFRFYWMQHLILLILITIFISIFLLPSQTEKKSFIESPTPTPTQPLPTPTGPLREVPPRRLVTEPFKNLWFNLQILLFFLSVYVAFLIWRLWWLWRANLFLQRHNTTQQPELHKIHITGFEDKLVSNIVLFQVAQSLRYRVRIPSHELDVDKTVNATLSQGGWLTPVYRTYQVIPEYLFLINRASYRDHQAKFVEEIIEGLKQEGVFITIYFFNDDPRMCFLHEHEGFSLTLREITSKYSQHCLVIISDTGNFFSTISGELEDWVNQLTSWKNPAILTHTPVENWGYNELELAQQFIILPATLKGLEVLSQRQRQGVATYFLSEETRIALPDSFRIQPERWIERNPPPSEQINAMLDSLEKYLGKDSFYWLSACAVFPELHWNITIYLGNVLKTESGESLLEVCLLTDLARLPWLRYGYIPDWLRAYLITILTPEEQQRIRTALQDLLITAVQGSVSKLQLQIAIRYHTFLPKLANPILYLLSKKAAVDSPLRDYIFLGFMTGKSVLAMRVSDEFSRSLQKQKRYSWWMKILWQLGIEIKPPIHQPSFVNSPKKLRLLVGGSIFAVFAVVIIISSIPKTPQLSQNTESQPSASPSISSTNSPMTAEDFFNRGNDKREKKDYQGAVEDYSQAIKINLNYADAYYNRGFARSALEDNKGAIEDYSQVIKINPNYADAYYNRGLARYALKDYKGAIEDYSQAIKINPNSYYAYTDRGLARYALKDYKGAIEDYSQAI